MQRIWRHGFVTLPRDIGGALLLGVLIAGIINTFVSPNEWRPYLGGGVMAIVLMMVVGVPLYVCASASVPIAAGFIHAGASPGAALAFLIAGPGTNAATITTLWKILGRRTALLYLGTIAASAVGCGLILDWIMPTMDVAVSCAGDHVHEAMGGGWQGTTWAILLLAIFVYSYAAKPESDSVHNHEDEHAQDISGEEEQMELKISGMSCQHCQRAVREALSECPGVTSAEVDLASGHAKIFGKHLNIETLIAAVKSAGYDAKPIC
jgi:copper chaperone CopZ